MFRQHKLFAFGQGMSQKTKHKHCKSTKSRDTINKTKVVKIVDNCKTQKFYASLKTEKIEMMRLRKQILVYR